MGGHSVERADNRESSNNVLLAEKQELFTPRLPTDMDEPVPLFPEIRSHINMTTAVEVSIGPRITIESTEVHSGLFEDGSWPASMEETGVCGRGIHTVRSKFFSPSQLVVLFC